MQIKLIIIFYLLLLLLLGISTQECANFDNDYACSENQYSFPESFDENCFQTPPRNDIYGKYKSTFQDMHYLVGYAQMIYSSNRNECTINFITKVNPKLGIENEDFKIIYKFGGIEQNSNCYIVTSDNSFPEGMPISAEIIDLENENNILAKLVLENIYFIWDNIRIDSPSNYENGKKGVIVELYGWPYEDIAEECEFLGYAGYMGIRINIPNESILTFKSTVGNELNPLDFILNPVSYKLKSRMGDKQQLKNMINQCRKNGIRVYSEIIINHMTKNGYDLYDMHTNTDCSLFGSIEGSAGSPFWTIRGLNKNNKYTRLKPIIEFPSVPYCASDFHCYSYISYGLADTEKLNFGWLYTFSDLNTDKDYVRQRIADFLTELISIGISGFSIETASDNISPSNYAAIFKKLKNNLGNNDLPEDFLIYIDIEFWSGSARKNLMICNDNDYNYAEVFTNKLSNEGFSSNDIKKIKLWNINYLNNLFPICDSTWKILPERFVLSLANHNNQNPGAEDIYIVHHNLNEHKNRNIQLLSDNSESWKIKLIFSSYSIMENGGAGFPDGKSDCSKCITEECNITCTKSVPFSKAYDPLSTGYDTGDNANWKENKYTRVHRNIEIVNAMRIWMGLSTFENEDALFQNEKPKANCSENCLICNEESKNLNKCIYCNFEGGYFLSPDDNIYERYHTCINDLSNYNDSDNSEFFTQITNQINITNSIDSTIDIKSITNEIILNNTNTQIEITNSIDSTIDIKSITNEIIFNNTNTQIEITNSIDSTIDLITKSNEITLIESDKLKINEYFIPKNYTCPEYFPYYNKISLKCEKECSLEYFFENICLTYYNSNEIRQRTIDMIKYNIIENLENKFLYEELIYKKQDLLKKEENIIYQITTSENQNNKKYTNLSTINLDECENELKKHYKIEPNNSLIIFKIEFFMPEYLIPIIEYEIFNPITKEPLDLKYCIESTINLNIPVSINEKEMYKYYQNSSFYSDKCFPYNENGVDINVNDRKNEYNKKNLSLCEKNCEFIDYDKENKKASCKCQTKTFFEKLVNININKDKLINKFIDIENTINIDPIFCYKTLFCLEGLKYNLGNYILSFIIIINLIFTGLFYFKEYFLFFETIKKILDYYKNKNKKNLNNLNSGGKNYNNINTNYCHHKKNQINKSINNNETFKGKKNNMNLKIKQIKRPKKRKINKNNSKIKKGNSSSSNKFSKHPKSSINLDNSNIIINPIIKKDNVNLILKKTKNDLSDLEINELDYQLALIIDKRSYSQFYLSLLKTKHSFIFSFILKNDYNSRFIKICLFFFAFGLLFFIHSLFFQDIILHKIYEDNGDFNFIYRIPQIIYSNIISIVISYLIKFLSLTQNTIILYKNRKDSKNVPNTDNIIKTIKIKIILFFILSFLLLFFFWYYISCFCAIYKYTQIHLTKDILMSFGLSLIYPFAINLIPGIFRIPALKKGNINLYKISQIIQIF